MTSATRVDETWKLRLECGHRTTRRVQHYVYEPRPPIPAPKHIYCTECRRVPERLVRLAKAFKRQA